jgi:hypothetical protein
LDRLRDKVQVQAVDRFPVVDGLGGKEYRATVEAAFADSSARLVFLSLSGTAVGEEPAGNQVRNRHSANS